MLTKCIGTSHKIGFFQNIFLKKSKNIPKILKKIQHLPLSFYRTPFECFKTVFTFYVAPPKKKCARSEVFFLLLGGVYSHRPGKIIKKKYMHNPAGGS